MRKPQRFPPDGESDGANLSQRICKTPQQPIWGGISEPNRFWIRRKEISTDSYKTKMFLRFKRKPVHNNEVLFKDYVGRNEITDFTKRP
jgi:hypothetical protein